MQPIKSHLYNIDFLKSLAILFVFLYHFEPSLFKSGYIGVDVFLVVTGYLSAMSLSKYTPWQFIQGRLKRIYPSLSAMLIVSFIFIIIFGFYNEIINFSKYTISSSLLLTNLHLFLDEGYFSESTASNLLFHLWSISLEFQLWLILAITYFIESKTTIRFFAAVSFIASIYFLFILEINMFYLNPLLRFWEPWLGFEIYLLSNKSKYKFKFPLHYLLFATIFIIIFLDLKDYYILWLFTPIICALFLLCDFSPKTAEYHVFRFVSARTYAYYLWHVPVIVSLSYYFLLTGWLKLLTVVVITIVLSELSYNLIEKDKLQHTHRKIRRFIELYYKRGD